MTLISWDVSGGQLAARPKREVQMMDSAVVDLGSLSAASRVVFRIGLGAAGVMAVFNTLNGVGTLIDPTFGQTDPAIAAQPVWMSVMLVTFGLTTLAALVPAWKGVRWAIVVVVASRLLEAWSAIVLPFLPGAPEGIGFFVVVLIVVGTGVALMVAQSLRVKA